MCGLDEGDRITPPIVIDCASCDQAYDIFETDMGWDGELTQGGTTDYDPVNDLEPPDLPVPHGIVVRFEYGSETLGDPQGADRTGREHDLFTWITILARDADTGALSFLFEYECA
jgi:hypothetical protein